MNIEIQESPCLGSCAYAPCVGIEHDDYEGPVALEGMYEDEFRSRTFRNILLHVDVERLWSIVLQSVRTEAAADNFDIGIDEREV
jgi:hypothetical protein